MTTIELVANDQLLQVTVNPTISSGEQNTVEVHVDFSDDWDGFSKSAVFFTSLNKNAIYEIVMTDGKCIVPAEVMEKSCLLYVGVRGVNSENNEVKTTSLVKYKILEGTPTTKSTEVEPTPDVYHQLLTAYGKTDNAINKEISDRKSAISTEKAERQAEIAVERARIDNMSTLTEGSTTADAELLDIRVKADGSTATSAGNAVREQVSELKSDLSQLSEETTTLREDLNALRDGDSYNYIGDLPQTPNFRPVYLLASEDTVLTIGENLCFGLESRLIDGSVNPYTGNTVFYTNCIDVVFNDTNGVTFTRNGTIWQNAYLLFAIPAEVGKTYTVSAEYTDAYMRVAETDTIEGNIGLLNFSSYAEVNSNGRYAISLTASKAYVLIQTFTKNNATTTINKVAVTDDGTTAYSESKTINLTGGSYTEYVNTVGELIPAGSVPIGLYQKISSGSGETNLSAVYDYVDDLPQTPNFRPVYLLASEDTVLTIGENLCFGLESRLIDGSVNPYTGNTVFYTNCIDVVFNDTNGVTFTRNGTIWQNAYLLFAIPAEVGKTYTVSAEYTDAYMRVAETDTIEGNIGLLNFSSYAEVNSNGRYAISLTASKAYVLIQTFTKNNATTTINKVAVTDDGTTAYSESKTINLTGGSYTEYVNTVGELIPAGSVPIGLYQKISSGSGETNLSAVYDYVDEKLETKLDRSGYTESGNLIVNEDGEVMIQEDANEVYVFLGDSIPTFDANTGGDGAIPDYMQKLIGGTWHNFGIGGTTMASYTSSNNTYDMFTFGELADSIASGDFTNQEIGVTNGVGAGSTDYSASEKVADMKVLDWSMVNTIFAHFGTNDLAYGNSVGGVDDVASKNGTMVASLKYAINKILSTYPTMKIVICGIIYRYADNPSVSSIISANKVIKESCESIGVPYVDLFSKMCVNQSNKDSFLYDGTHPNENGKVRYAECLAKEVF